MPQISSLPRQLHCYSSTVTVSFHSQGREIPIKRFEAETTYLPFCFCSVNKAVSYPVPIGNWIHRSWRASSTIERKWSSWIIQTTHLERWNLVLAEYVVKFCVESESYKMLIHFCDMAVHWSLCWWQARVLQRCDYRTWYCCVIVRECVHFTCWK